MKNTLNLIRSLVFALVICPCASAETNSGTVDGKQHEAELASKSKVSNWVVFNRLADSPSGKLSIIGIYVSPAGGQPPRLNQKIKWGRNLISKPIGRGEYAALFINTAKDSWYDVRIDFDGKDSAGSQSSIFINPRHCTPRESLCIRPFAR